MERKMIKVGITHGNVNGIGYEVILKALSDNRLLDLCVPIIYGSAKVAAYHRKMMELPAVNLNAITKSEEAGINKVNIINCIKDDIKVELSKITREAEEAAYLAMKQAVTDLKRGFLDVIVTAPGFEKEKDDFTKEVGVEQEALTVLVKDDIKIALVTENIPIKSVPESLTEELILSKLKVFHQSLIADFGIRAPRIAVFSLNPGLNEKEFVGEEEQNIIIPAMEAAGKSGILCFGPYAPDDFFGWGDFDRFDGVLAMYRDQGMIPFKTLVMEEGAHFMAGLPVIRTSPGYGSLYEFAGKNKVSEDAFRNALYLALDIYRNRMTDESINARPLKKEYFEKGSDNEKLDLTKDDN